MTDSSHEPRPPRVDTAHVRMEALIAAMRRPSAQPAGSTTRTDDERLALAAWRAIRPAVPTDPVTDPVSDQVTDVASDVASDLAPRVGAGEPPLEPGATLGRYVVRRPLGAGGMGVVYEAHDPELDRMVALKLVPPDRIGHEHRTRLLREAQALARLSHPNVVKVFDVGTRGEQLWVAMERVHGQTLREWLRTPRSWRGVLRLVEQAARGLAAAHEAGLLHRDFKPENVMLGDDGVVRVMDFDLARSLPGDDASAEPEAAPAGLVPTLDTLALNVTHTEMLVGTPGYMAPEQLLGEPLTPAADQFALCVSLWEGLFGERPFTGDTLEELVRNVLAGVPARPRTEHAVPGWLRRTCERGLAVRPEDRFESIDALLASLGRRRLRARAWIGVLVAGVLAAAGVGVEACGRLDRSELEPPRGAHGRSP